MNKAFRDMFGQVEEELTYMGMSRESQERLLAENVMNRVISNLAGERTGEVSGSLVLV